MKPTPLSQKLGRDVFFRTAPDLPRIIEIDLAKLRPNPDQPRTVFGETALRELADSIARHGLIQPIVVREDAENPDTFIVVAGERRWRACTLLGKETIAAIITQGNPDEIALIENIQREDLSPLEEAEAFSRMMERYGYTQEELGKVIGKAQSTVSELLLLTKLPQAIKDACQVPEAPTISKSVLIEIARHPNEDEQLALWEEAKTGQLSVKATREKKKNSTATTRTPATTHPTLAAGRRFVRALANTPALSKDEYYALLELRKEINDLIERVEK